MLTNPGSGMAFQHITNQQNTAYKTIQKVLKDIYTSKGFVDEGGKTAYQRLHKSMAWAMWWDFSGLINVDTIPFHSDKLDKTKGT